MLLVKKIARAVAVMHAGALPTDLPGALARTPTSPALARSAPSPHEPPTKDQDESMLIFFPGRRRECTLYVFDSRRECVLHDPRPD